ncbi:hypothetical protein TNCV_3506951 [Trichonephila clavipes]|uniref:Uncharacterized protein n=1 Tax=Trichonephila clavipes TaxID=2585209 RepID=A0A8X6S1M7_TRICX|nr:hypothetical protein TNCV_3506951 [Trichonephila clavipes]
MNFHNRLNESLKWRDVGRLEAGQNQVEEASLLQVAPKVWSPGYEINSKQVIVSPGGLSTGTSIGSLLCIECAMT